MLPFLRHIGARRTSPRGGEHPPYRPRLEQLETRDLPSTFSFSTGLPDGRMATASHPGGPHRVEVESADDFLLPAETFLQQATFTGLLPAGSSAANVTGVRIEIYRVFPRDSNTNRTFDVPTRLNSPADLAFVDRSTDDGGLGFHLTVLAPHFTAGDSVNNGISPLPNQQTGGDGPVAGEEVQFHVHFTEPMDLPADHYFFVPQVQLKHGKFFWLSAAPGQFTNDLQEWIRSSRLEPDWLRVGTDIVGGTAFDGAFSLTGQTTVRAFFPFRYKAAGAEDQGILALQNLGTFTRRGPLFVLFPQLPPGVTLENATGSDNGIPYLALPGTVNLAHHRTVTIPVVFHNPLAQSLSTFYQGLPVEVVPVLP